MGCYDTVSILFIDSKWTVLESPINVNQISYSDNNIFIIGSNDIYTLSLFENNIQKYHVIPPFSIGEIDNFFSISNNNFFITKYDSTWEEFNWIPKMFELVKVIHNNKNKI